MGSNFCDVTVLTLFPGPLAVIVEDTSCQTWDELKKTVAESTYGPNVVQFLQTWFEAFQTTGTLVSCLLNVEEIKWSGWELKNCSTIDSLVQTCLDRHLSRLLEWCYTCQTSLLATVDWETQIDTCLLVENTKALKWIHQHGFYDLTRTSDDFIRICSETKLSIISWLLELGIPDQIQQKGFFSACYHGRLCVAKWLVQNNPNIDIHMNSDEPFFNSVFKNHLEVAQWLWSLGGVRFQHGPDLFQYTCSHNMLDMAQWLYSLGNVNIHSFNEGAFVSACANGHLPVAQWLWSLGNVDLHIGNHRAFRYACEQGKLDIIKWLWSLEGSQNVHTVMLKECFTSACASGHLDVAQWLYSLEPLRDEIIDDGILYHAFSESCRLGHLSVAQWIHSLNLVNPHHEKHKPFRLSIHNGHLHVAQWLWSLGGIDQNTLVEIYQPHIHSWLSTLFHS